MQGEVDFRRWLLVSHRPDGGIEIVVMPHRRPWRTRAGAVFHFDGLWRWGEVKVEWVGRLQETWGVEYLKPLNTKSPCGPRTNAVAVEDANRPVQVCEAGVGVGLMANRRETRWAVA